MTRPQATLVYQNSLCASGRFSQGISFQQAPSNSSIVSHNCIHLATILSVQGRCDLPVLCHGEPKGTDEYSTIGLTARHLSVDRSLFSGDMTSVLCVPWQAGG